MSEFKFPLLTLPVISAGCFAALTDGENWVGIERERCNINYTGYVSDTGEYGYYEDLDCEKEDLPYAVVDDRNYYYGQYFLDIGEEFAILSYMYAGSYDDTIYSFSKAIVMTYKQDGDTYEFELEDEDIECEVNRDDELECEGWRLVMQKTSSAFNYDGILERIYEEYQ